MKFGIDMGHNAPPDTGASSQFGSEDKLTKAVGTAVMAKLKALGHEVISCNPSSAGSVIDSLRKRVNTANASDVDVYVSIHFNAFNSKANGAEVLAISESSKRIAKPILDNIVNLGFSSRGIKDGSHLFVLKNTKMPSILIECCFVDSEKDMKLFNTEKMVDAIVKGLAGKLPEGVPPSQGNSQILDLQKKFNRLKIRDGSGQALKEDGVAGESTSSALKRFHQVMGIKAEGSPVSLTWEALDEILLLPTLRVNHAEGYAVRYLEFRMGGPVDGVYDAQVGDRVANFQRQNSLTGDGIVGEQTWSKLLA